MNEASDGSSILVTGDAAIDHYIYEGRQRRAGSKIRLGTVAKANPGGASLLHELLRALAARTPARFSTAFGFDVSQLAGSAIESHCVMRPFEKKPKEKGEVWRLAEALGLGACNKEYHAAAINAPVLEKDHSVVVLDDAGLQFRRWPSRAAWPRFLTDAARPLPAWLILKMSSPVATGDLWHTIVSGCTQEHEPKRVRDDSELRNRTVAVISIHDLRVEPIQVSKNLSWEQVAFDLVHELTVNPSIADLRKLRFLIVNFGTDAALIAEFAAGQAARFRLLFDPGRLEGEFDAGIRGTAFGYQTCFTASIVSHIASIPGSSKDPLPWIERGVRAGLCAMRRLLVDGHGPVEKPGFPLKALAEEIAGEKHEWPYGSVEIPLGKPRYDRWTIAAGNTSGNAMPLWGLARRVARQGLRQLHQLPYLQFGKLFSIDRAEIESLRTLQRLMISYQNDPKAEKPLSLAAFGPPGSGKSFGVKQLAKAVLSDATPLLEFNLSQFRDASELHGLFHQIRDEVLRGKLPVVFWDEFDSRNLEWLQYLLAPMQDGAFQAGQLSHPIGKCVFVFAGGTRSRFEDFGEPPVDLVTAIANAKNDAEKSKLEERCEMVLADFVAKKVRDFKSRLAGYINVLGPNSRDSHDITYPVRRALLLRVLLGAGPNDDLAIDPGLLTAFLEIDEYRHGARSMEKIAEQIRLASRTGEFIRSDLPASGQLEMHVSAQRFLALVERDP
jgi:hypothetical protein